MGKWKLLKREMVSKVRTREIARKQSSNNRKGIWNKLKSHKCNLVRINHSLILKGIKISWINLRLSIISITTLHLRIRNQRKIIYTSNNGLTTRAAATATFQWIWVCGNPTNNQLLRLNTTMHRLSRRLTRKISRSQRLKCWENLTKKEMQTRK